MSQTQIIWDFLSERKGDWVAMTTLGMEASCWAVHSRIADIRAYGQPVENKLETCPITKKRFSYYRIPAAQRELPLTS